jgi:hypothetical protein
LSSDEFVLEDLQRLVVQLEVKLESAIRDPPSAFEEVHDLVKHVIKIHYWPSSCIS